MRGVLCRGSKLEDVTAEDFPLPHLGPVLLVIPALPFAMQLSAHLRARSKPIMFSEPARQRGSCPWAV